MREGYGLCPVCHGTCRMPAGNDHFRSVVWGYDSDTNTTPCRNCGGQTMWGKPTGEAKLRPDGTACKHEYTSREAGRCYTIYTCKHCGYSYDIDSGD